LRPAGHVVGPGDGQARGGVGVRDGAVVFPAPVRAPGDPDQTTWCACHVAAFEFFGGVPARLVCDNLKTGVDKPDLYDPKINRSYAELATHYGTLIDPAREFQPKDNPGWNDP